MKPREIAAWTIATLAVLALICVLASDWDRKPQWTLLNTRYGAVRMDQRTGETQRLVGGSWRAVNQADGTYGVAQ